MKRLTLFSFFDPDNKIDTYVVFYLKELSKFSDIIFSSDCYLSDAELDKIRHLVIDLCVNKHGEYDFGSYKFAYKKAVEKNNIQNYDWLLLVNDSCYGPFSNLSPVFKKMESQDIDFWGFSHNTVDIYPHIQSYFVSLSKECFMSGSFVDFINSVKKQQKRKDVVFKYEHGLTRVLVNSGFKYNTFFEESKERFVYNPAKKWDLMIDNGFPFIKRSLFTRNSYNLKNLRNYKSVILRNNPEYNIDLIKENLERYKVKRYQYKLEIKLKKMIIKIYNKLFRS